MDFGRIQYRNPGIPVNWNTWIPECKMVAEEGLEPPTHGL
jgi:hypothetical protein